MLQGEILHYVQAPQLLAYILHRRALDAKKKKKAHVNAHGKIREQSRSKKEEQGLHWQ